MEVNKYGLALHTSTRELGLAISNFAGDSRAQVWNLDRELSNLLHQYLGEFIKPQTWADLAFIAVAKGPGGFTGTRIGVVTARTLAQQLNIPVFAISTLAAVALSHHNQISRQGKGAVSSSSSRGGDGEKSKPDIIAVQMPAQRGQLFVGIYQICLDVTSNVSTLLLDTVMMPQAWQEKLDNGHTPYELVKAEGGLGATVTRILELAYREWQQGKRPSWVEALPFYGQHPVEL